MPGIRLLKATAVMLALVGMLFPQARILASEQKAVAKNQIKVLPPNSILDLKLGKDGALSGRTINHGGVPLIGTTVIVSQGKTELANALTDQRGNFSIPNLKPGIYDVGTGTTIGTYRVWSENSAPPSAKPHCLLVTGENGARGQYGLVNTIAEENLGLILLASTTGLALAGLLVALHAEKIAKAAESKSP